MSKIDKELASRSFVRRIEYVVVRAVAAVLGMLPERAAYFLAEWLVLGGVLLLPRFRRRALAHLEIAFGKDHDLAWRERIATESLRQFAWYLIDVVTAVRKLRTPEGLAQVDLSELEEAFRRDGITEKTGALIVGGHLGVPEVCSLAMALDGWPNTVIIRRLDNRFLWDWVQRQRQGVARTMLEKKGALRSAYKVLKARGIVGMLIDQDAGSKGRFVRYFGKRASTHGSAATLALTSGAPVYMVNGFRTERRRFRYRVLCEGPIDFTPSGDHHTDEGKLTARMTQALERAVTRYPEQNMWAHRRWRTRPPWTAQGKRRIENRKRRAEERRARRAGAQ